MKIKRVLSAILAFGILATQCAAALAAEPYGVMDTPFSGYALKTPEENLFYLEGYENGFILLDVGITDESKFLVMTREGYGTVQFDGDATQKFDVNDPNNIGYFLNNEFMNRTYDNMPPEIIEHIDKNHTWVTEPGSPDGNCPEEYETTCGITVMSMTEAELYNGMYGVQDDFTVGWWLRTARGDGLPKAGLSMRVSNDQYLGRAFEYFTDGLEQIRPLFYLDKDFFKDVRLDVERVGANVAKRLTEVYDAEELQNGEAQYANHEMRMMGFDVEGIDEIAEITFNNAPSYIMDQDDAYFNVSMNITGEENITYDILYTVGEDSYSDTMEAVPGREVVKKITLENLPKGVHEVEVTVMNGTRRIKSASALVGIVDYYEPQFMDEYNRGMMSTHFIMNNQTDQTELDIMTKIGVLAHRDEIYWANIEPQAGVWDFSSPDQFMNWTADAGLKSMIIVDFSNNNYVPDKTGGTDPTKTAPRTQEELAAFCEYVKQILNRYPNITAIEIWNETNWGFWQPEPNALDYATMVKAVSMAAREVRPDIYIMAGSFVYISGTQYFYDFFDQNIFPYVDAISSHPYVFPINVDPALPDRLKVGIDIFDSYGGFKDHVVTEVGLTTSTTSSGVSDRVQAKELLKNYVYNDAYNVELTCWYNFRDKGDNPADNEHNFGIINRDYTAKDAFIVLSQRNNRLNGSVYQGQVDLGTGIQAHLYAKDGEQMMVAWKESGSANVNIPNSGVEDMFGNPIDCGDTVPLGEEAIYILGIKEDYYHKATSYTANKYYNTFQEHWQDIYNDNGVVDELKNAALSLTADTPLSDIKAAFDKNNALAEDIIAQHKAGALGIEDKDMMSMLNDVWRAQIQWANLYAAKGGTADRNVVNNAYEAVNQKIDEKVSVDYFATMYVSQELLRQAERYDTRMNEINAMGENPGKQQAVIFNAVMADVLSNWADLVSDFEKVDEYSSVMVYSDPSRMDVYQGESEDITVTVENRKTKSIDNFEIVVKDDEGNEVSRTDPMSVESGRSISSEVEVSVPNTKLRGEYMYTIELQKDGETISTRGLYVNVKGVIDVKMQEADKPLSSLKNIKVQIDNIYDRPLALQIDIKGPEGWSFVEDSKSIRVNSNSTTVVEFEIDSKQKYPFNNYSFEVTAQDHDGNILYQEKKPLDMPIIIENTAGIAPADFTGDMSDWSDAYPIYLNAPENPDLKSSWEGLDISGRMYAKWDSEYFYFIADINDETFIQSFSKDAVWNNDSIQVSWDTKNDKASGAYQPDDYEFGFSLTSAGNEVWAYFDGPGTFGEKPSEWLKVIRDNTKKITRYYARIPLSELSDLTPSSGKKIGFNIAVNDADLTSRDEQIYLTEGTGSPIDPSKYMTFIFQKADTKLEEADVEPPLEVVISENYEQTAPLFDDILGHWGQADIQALAEKNIVSGYDGKFYPDDNVTRAEFLKLLLAACGISPDEATSSYPDVASDAWYAGYVQAAYNRGIIPAEMTGDGFKPNDAITREEMAVMLCNAASVTGAGTEDDLNVFNDKDSISEWTRLYVARAVRAGILYGDDQGNYNPQQPCTRAEAAAIIKRLYDKNAQ